MYAGKAFPVCHAAVDLGGRKSIAWFLGGENPWQATEARGAKRSNVEHEDEVRAKVEESRLNLAAVDQQAVLDCILTGVLPEGPRARSGRRLARAAP